MSITRLKLLGYCAIATAIPYLALSIASEKIPFPPFNGINQAIAQTRPTDQQQRRIALVIGNANYEVSKLGTPLNDATDMNAALKELGFEVILLKDATQQQMDEAIDRFARQMTQGSVGLFYYAGHGIQIDGENYLIPVNNGLIKVEADVRYKSVALGQILGRMAEAENAVNIVILDACRDNPFRGFKRSLSRGLTAVQTATGSLIAFATAPGKVADDGNGRNGLFTSFLLKYIREPIDVDAMLRKVRAEVAKTTKNYQVPWNSSSLIGEFSFNSSPSVVTAPTPTPIITPSPVFTPQPTPPTQPRSTLISSTTGVDYTTLRELLQQKKWKEADQKTWDLMLAAAKREKERWIDSKSAEKFSCEDLRMIDREWLDASGGQFGFSVQLSIYKQTGNSIGDYNDEVWQRFGDAVGWRVNGNWKTYDVLTWSTNAPSSAPKGHLPSWRPPEGGWMGADAISRVAACEL
ncbi:GUN4 domain-containing protein [Microcystis sp. LEGE 00066]|uniref:Genome sequencing data, contig C250 n=1 Tax=Microcystis aeruginosa (strain PCC 7806) TaxID=267872 RepID=A8YAC2_MICA7|nr:MULTISPECIES: caspase family protein [Microcystis]TRT99102.1 MAG: peptidase C14 [Microcystis aeruginosa Ma_AC_P_19900807_S300]ELS47004.1 caspase domain protein [Microcystis aeruginosa FACHB-905 = DIANCHI905]MBE9264542.1 GUN4 domain-containing protein [Microcystis sp. LEGE 00066]UGS09674.1 GUN4 domain-containing protein [Microcystis aeruginosa FACHB-905 = DIANCHI905]WKX60718.1 GUN4 domain-containing protein [Microcystis aeruginosa PCC 7806]